MSIALQNHRIIPVVEIDDDSKACALTEALLEGGINIIEITLRTAAGLEALDIVKQRYDEMLVGAGTVLTTDQAERVCDIGIDFGVAPGLNPDIVKTFQSSDIDFLPGVITPTELEFAVKLDCKYLKFFPAGPAGGPTFLRALSAPYTDYGVTFCATGGVSLDNMNDYLKLPLVSAIGGSWIATRKQITDSDWSSITQQCIKANERLQSL